MSNLKTLLKQFNEAFINYDTDFIVQQVTDDIVWNIVGDKVIEGKANFEKALREMEDTKHMDCEILNIITHGNVAAVNGIIVTNENEGEQKRYEFCDIYNLQGFKNPFIKSMTSYVIEAK